MLHVTACWRCVLRLLRQSHAVQLIMCSCSAVGLVVDTAKLGAVVQKAFQLQPGMLVM